jgi:hypothetical protein
MPEFYSLTMPVARKQHKCSECRCAIPAGQKYESASGKWDGMFQQFKTCQRCIDLRAYMKAHVPCFCFSYENMLGDAIDTAREWKHEAPGLLFHVYRYTLTAERERKAVAA